MNKRIKKSFLAFGLATLTLAAISFSGCNASSEKERVANEAAQKLIESQNELAAAKKDYAEKLAAFQVATDNKIAENENSIAALKVEIKKKSKTVRAELDAKLAALELKNQLMKEKARDYKDESAEQWEAFKIEFNRDMDNLGQALKDLTTSNTK